MLVGNVVKLEQDATRLATGNVQNKGFGKPVLPCSFGGSSYYGLCDIGSSINVNPYDLYLQIKSEMCAPDIELVHMSIVLADRSPHEPIGVINDDQNPIGSHAYFIDLVIMDVPVDPFFQ